MNMKHLMQRLLLLLPLLTLGGCTDDEVETPNYYVKYEVFALPHDKMTIYYMDEYSHMKLVEETLPTGRFERVVGPVKSGYKAAMVVSRKGDSGSSENSGNSERLGNAAEKLQISVAVAGEPYVVKQSGKHYYELTYQIP